MELIQKQANQEPRGKVYLGKRSKRQFLKPWPSGILQGLHPSLKSFTTDTVKWGLYLPDLKSWSWYNPFVVHARHQSYRWHRSHVLPSGSVASLTTPTLLFWRVFLLTLVKLLPLSVLWPPSRSCLFTHANLFALIPSWYKDKWYLHENYL